MIKKIIFGIIIIGVISLLVIGGINRTNTKLASNNGTELNIHQQNDFTEQDNGQQGRNYAHQDTDENLDRRGNGNGASNYVDDNERSYTGEGQTNIESWIVVQATVIQIDNYSMLSENSSGEQFELRGRPLSYAQEQGFDASVGDQLEIEGFYDSNGIFEPTQITNQTNDLTVIIRDESGRPMWSGGGKGRNGGNL